MSSIASSSTNSAPSTSTTTTANAGINTGSTNTRPSSNPRLNGVTASNSRAPDRVESPELEIVQVRRLARPVEKSHPYMGLLKQSYDVVHSKGYVEEIDENIKSEGVMDSSNSFEGAEVSDMEGPVQQVQLYNLLLKQNNIPQMVFPCPYTFEQASVQSHFDLIPLVIILFDEEDICIEVMRLLNNNQEMVQLLGLCLVWVAHTKSPDLKEVLQVLKVAEDADITGAHLVVLQHSGLLQRQIIGGWLTGDGITPSGIKKLLSSSMDNIRAIEYQRKMIEDTRQLRTEQDQAAAESAKADQAATQTRSQEGSKEMVTEHH